MPGRIERKWRPSLALVLGATLAVVLCLPLLGIAALGALSPQLGRGGAVVLVIVAVVAATALVGWVFARILLQPIRGLAERARRLKAGDPDATEPMAHYGTAEMQELGQTILDMGRVLQGREAVLRSYADHVTHELKSPLTTLRGAAELLDNNDLSAAERQRLLARIDEAADRMTVLLDAQRRLARAQEPMPGGKARLSAVVTDLALEFPGLELVVAADRDLPLSAEGLRLVLEHLFGNAADHGAGRVTLTAGDDRLTVADDGPGVSQGNRDRVFEPFFTTRREAGGTGMGLPIVRRILEAHGAAIRLGEGRGAVFEIEF